MECTKREWKVIQHGGKGYEFTIRETDENNELIRGIDGEIATVHLNRSVKIAEANARLIAAAPDLYEACKIMRALLKNRATPNSDAWNFIEKAIAKAEGK